MRGARRAVRPARRRLAARRRADGRAPGPVEPHRPREDRPAGRGSAEPLRVPPRLPGRSARRRLRLRALVEAARRRKRPDGLRARRHRARLPRRAGAPVLVLLRVQRLQQHARGRLGDDPAPLRRGRRRRRARRRAGRRRLQLARGRRERRVGETTSSSSSTRPTRSSTRAPARTRTSSPRRSTSAAPPRPVSAATTRAVRTVSCVRSS